MEPIAVDVPVKLPPVPAPKPIAPQTPVAQAPGSPATAGLAKLLAGVGAVTGFHPTKRQALIALVAAGSLTAGGFAAKMFSGGTPTPPNQPLTAEASKPAEKPADPHAGSVAGSPVQPSAPPPALSIPKAPESLAPAAYPYAGTTAALPEVRQVSGMTPSLLPPRTLSIPDAPAVPIYQSYVPNQRPLRDFDLSPTAIELEVRAYLLAESQPPGTGPRQLLVVIRQLGFGYVTGDLIAASPWRTGLIHRPSQQPNVYVDRGPDLVIPPAPSGVVPAGAIDLGVKPPPAASPVAPSFAPPTLPDLPALPAGPPAGGGPPSAPLPGVGPPSAPVVGSPVTPLPPSGGLTSPGSPGPLAPPVGPSSVAPPVGPSAPASPPSMLPPLGDPVPKMEYTKPSGGSTAFPSGPDARTPQTSFDVDLYEPRSGDTYQTVSRDFYNDTRYAAALAEFNNRKPLTGGRVEVPPIHVLRKRYPQLIGAPAAEPYPPPTITPAASIMPTVTPTVTPAIPPPAFTTPRADDSPAFRPSGATATVQKSYLVKRQKVNIPEVAKEVLGSEFAWKEIADLNPQIKLPGEYLPVGTELKLPADAKPQQ